MKAAEWVKALRSGDFKQTKRMLSDGADGFVASYDLRGPVGEYLGLAMLITETEVL